LLFLIKNQIEDMLQNQKDLFQLDESTIYLNAAYMSPQMKEMTKVGTEQLIRKSQPNSFGVDDFFEPRKSLKKKFADLIGAEDYQSIAIIPSVSYGVASVVNNIGLSAGEEIVVCEAQFPSHIYSWQKLAAEKGGKVIEVKAPALRHNRGIEWNRRLLESINVKTKVVALPQVHWADGTYFDLVNLRKRATEVGAKLIIDGTQSVGAMPFSVKEIQPDALICAGYKWLLGPYGMGVAYFAESFWEGNPIEHNWVNRYKSEDFTNLTKYQEKFQPGAERYSVGESSNFILTAMLKLGIEQTLKWGPGNIQEYCGSLISSGIEKLRSNGCFVEVEGSRGNHMFGVYLSESMDIEVIKRRLQEKGVFVSYRGDAIRVSPHVYNNQEDFDLFVSCVY
jgi:selenocysteine lyase/cysteine desulfurase